MVLALPPLDPPEPPVIDLWMGSVDSIRVPGSRMNAFLSTDDTDRGERFVRPLDRDRFLASRVVLRWVLSRYLPCSPEETEIHAEPGKKPYQDHREGVEFNLAHSEDLLVIGVGGLPLGVDVEYLRPMRDMDQVAEHVFTPEELLTLRSLSAENREMHFYSLWTAKESVLKGMGLGLSVEPSALRVSPVEGGARGSLVNTASSGFPWLISPFRHPFLGPTITAVGAVAISDRLPVLRTRPFPPFSMEEPNGVWGGHEDLP